MDEFATVWHSGGRASAPEKDISEDELHGLVHNPTVGWVDSGEEMAESMNSLPKPIQRAVGCAALELYRIHLENDGLELDYSDPDNDTAIQTYCILMLTGAALYREAVEGRLIFDGK